ncbi:MAG: MOSC domain-containing protein [Ignavibacteriaceae bacterium]|nr:MOSC domain-containing protein [Ignavibacteriaceae bacterium]
MNKLQLTGIYIYPIKSCSGISLQSSEVEDRGLKYDRRWMIVDENGTFLTQRDHPQMTKIKISLLDEGLLATDKLTKSSVKIPFDFKGEKIKVKIWGDVCLARVFNNTVNLWFSDVLKINCKLVFMPDDEKRIADRNYVEDERLVSFADAYPFLIVGQSSLDDLNQKLDSPVPVDRFRPNFVFSGGEPFCEDNLKNFKIGNVNFRSVKPCSRCVIVTTDQMTAERFDEPLKTLSTYRKKGNKVYFGQNLISLNKGIVRVGDEIILTDNHSLE